MFFFVSRVKGYLGKMGITGLVLLALALSGCSTDGTGNDAGSIYGNWVGSSDRYTITNTEFTCEFENWESPGVYDPFFTGAIINIRADGPGAGYITIKFTEHANSYYFANGDPFDITERFYVLHFKNLTSNFMEISQAYSFEDPEAEAIQGDYGDTGGDEGKATQAEAESIYTVDNGYFDSYSACTK